MVWLRHTAVSLEVSPTMRLSKLLRSPRRLLTTLSTLPSLSGPFGPLITPTRVFRRSPTLKDGVAGRVLTANNSITRTTGTTHRGATSTSAVPNTPEVEAEEAGEVPSPPPGRPLPRNRPKGSGARLPYFADNWAKVCSNNFILRIVAEGYKLQFISVPFQSVFVPRDMPASKIKICLVKAKEFG